jgi:pimeloyl-ACP methyl ester carboxylesterase
MKKLVFPLGILLVLTAFVSVRAKEKFAELQGAKVYYKDVGKGKNALVFIHGWTCNADFWRESVGEFPEYRVIAVDLPGHGRSDKPKTNYSMEYFAKAVEAVIKDAKVKKAVLVGHSMGTPVAREFYRLHPKKTLGIVIVDGGLRPFVTKKEMEAFVAPLRVNYKENAPQMISGILMGVKDDRLKTEIRSAMLATPGFVSLSAMDGMADEKIWTNDKINVPVLAILAESPYWKPDTKEFYQQIAPDLDFQMWSGVSHFLMMEKPAEFNREVRSFIVRKKLL